MRSITRNYRKLQGRNQNLGSYPCLTQAVKSRNFSRKSLVKAFKELMTEDEYDKDEMKGLIDYLEELTNIPE